jgi:hypothetical protein
MVKDTDYEWDSLYLPKKPHRGKRKKKDLIIILIKIFTRI